MEKMGGRYLESRVFFLCSTLLLEQSSTEMSRLLRFSKLSPLNNVLLTLTDTEKQLSYDFFACGHPVYDAWQYGQGRFHEHSNIADVRLFDPAKEKLITVPDKTIPKELLDSSLVGSSQGWGFFYDSRNGVFNISDFLNPFASKSNPKVITLPPLPTLPYNQTHFVRNVAMSSASPSEEEDFVVAIKLLGNKISLSRHGRDLRWTHLELPFNCLNNSNLVYSKTDQCFYLPTPGGNYLCLLDLHDDPKFRELEFRDLPELPKSELELLRSYSRAEHWVESSSGERFLVQWYSYDSPLLQRDPIFMVFREEETIECKYMCYTEDIGDVCIFLSNSHPFCVEASSCPGLEPNSIYIISYEDLAVYSLATRSCRDLERPKVGPEGGPIMVPFVPHWIPPFTF